MFKKEKGFTLIELIIVIAIIGILVAVMVPQYIAYKENRVAEARELCLKRVEAGAEEKGNC